VRNCTGVRVSCRARDARISFSAVAAHTVTSRRSRRPPGRNPARALRPALDACDRCVRARVLSSRVCARALVMCAPLLFARAHARARARAGACLPASRTRFPFSLAPPAHLGSLPPHPPPPPNCPTPSQMLSQRTLTDDGTQGLYYSRARTINCQKRSMDQYILILFYE
jgi:hypothetical protein